MFGWDDQRTHTEKTRDALTSAKKNKIKSVIGKCENCGKKLENSHLDVHHISEAAKADGTTDLNRPGNLVVLCPTCHRFAHTGEITKTALKAKVSKRSERVKKELKSILRGRPKIVDDSELSLLGSSPPPIQLDSPSFFDGSPSPKRKKPKVIRKRKNALRRRKMMISYSGFNLNRKST